MQAKDQEVKYQQILTGYGNDKLKIGYDRRCEQGLVKRDLLGRATINVPNCGCTHYEKRNCTGTMGEHNCTGTRCKSKSNPICCNSGDMCSPRMVGDNGTCIAGQPYPYDF